MVDGGKDKEVVEEGVLCRVTEAVDGLEEMLSGLEGRSVGVEGAVCWVEGVIYWGEVGGEETGISGDCSLRLLLSSVLRPAVPGVHTRLAMQIN